MSIVFIPTLAEVIAEKGDPDIEPARMQVVLVDGQERLMLACLDRTVVVEVDGTRQLVAHARIHVEGTLRWQPREKWEYNKGSRQLAIHHARRRAAAAAS